MCHSESKTNKQPKNTKQTAPPDERRPTHLECLMMILFSETFVCHSFNELLCWQYFCHLLYSWIVAYPPAGMTSVGYARFEKSCWVNCNGFFYELSGGSKLKWLTTWIWVGFSENAMAIMSSSHDAVHHSHSSLFRVKWEEFRCFRFFPSRRLPWNLTTVGIAPDNDIFSKHQTSKWHFCSLTKAILILALRHNDATLICGPPACATRMAFTFRNVALTSLPHSIQTGHK